MNQEEIEEKLLILLGARERQTQQVFLDIVQYLQERNQLGEIATLLERGVPIDDVIADLDRVAAQLSAEVVGTYLLATQSAAQVITEAIKAPVTYDAASYRAVEFAQAARLDSIREFTVAQRNMVRQVVTSGVERGLNPRAQAREVRASLGLTQHQTSQVDRYRQLLLERDPKVLEYKLRDGRFDRTIRAAFDRDQPLTRDQVAMMTDRYRERWVNYRSEVIARTESLRAVHLGTEEMWQQAVNEGEVEEDEIQRIWRTAADHRVRHSHRFMAGQKRSFKEPFKSGNGNLLRFPCDPMAPASDTVQCRCVVVTRLVRR